MSHSSRPARPWALPLGAVLGACATGASLAQAPGADSGGPSGAQRVVITGSNLRRQDFETAAPVQIFRRSDIEQSGHSTLSDFLRAGISANNSGTLPQAFSGAFAAGASGLALRGMSVNATLVLVDGLRMPWYPLADDAQRLFVDLSGIPLAAVERVEVYKGEASAVYGSDAIAGVVNVVLRRSVRGTEVTADAGLSERRDGGTTAISITQGFGSADDALSGYVSLEHRSQRRIRYDQRPGLANLDYRARGGPDLRGGVVQPGATIPFNGVPTAFGMVAPLDPVTRELLPDAGYQNLPGCAPQNLNDSGGCTFDSNEFRLIQPATKNTNLSGRLSMRLGAQWSATLSAALLQSRALQSNFLAYVPNAWGNYSTLGLVDQTDPTTSGVVLPIGHPDNPFAANPAFLSYSFNDVGPIRSETKTTVQRWVGEVSGSVSGWSIDAAAGVMKARTALKYTGSISASVLDQVLADGSYRVGASAGLNSPQLYARLAPDESSTATSSLQFGSVRGTTTVARLTGGPVDLGLGAELRKQELSNPGLPGALAGDRVGYAGSFASGSQSVAATYAEVSAPVLTVLSLDGAYRLDHYRGIGTSRTPSAGFRFTPTPTATLRGTYSKGFRAPGPAESGNSALVYFTSLGTDTERCPSTQLPSDCGSGLGSLLIAGNPDLKPERSTGTTLGLLLRPSEDARISLDWYRIKRRGEIAVAPFALAQPIRGAVQSNYPNLPGPVLAYSLPFANGSSTVTEGIDLALLGTLKFPGQGALTGELTVTRIARYTQCFGVDTCFEFAGTHGPTALTANSGTPKTRANLRLAWSAGAVTMGTTASYRSAMSNTDPSVDPNACLNAWYTPCRVASFTTFNLFGSYKIASNWTLGLHVVNLFNRAPPFDPQTYGGVNYSPAMDQDGAVGRAYRLSVKAAF